VSRFAIVRVAPGWYSPIVVGIQFGEFLVRRGLIDRFQLLQVLQFQARHPSLPLGECVVALGFLGAREVEVQLGDHDADRARKRLARGTVELPAVVD